MCVTCLAHVIVLYKLYYKYKFHLHLIIRPIFQQYCVFIRVNMDKHTKQIHKLPTKTRWLNIRLPRSSNVDCGSKGTLPCPSALNHTPSSNMLYNILKKNSGKYTNKPSNPSNKHCLCIQSLIYVFLV